MIITRILKSAVMSNKRTNNARLVQLEKRVDIAMKGLNVLLLRDSQEISPKEKKLLEQRMKDFTTRKKSSFVELNKYLQSNRFTRKRLEN